MRGAGAMGAAMMSLVLGACGGATSPEPAEPEARTVPVGPPIYVAMSAAFVSEAGVGVYEDIIVYLEQRTKRDFQLVTGLAYETIDGMVAEGAVEFAFVCGYPYVLGRDRSDPIHELIAAPVMADARYGGEPVYFSAPTGRRDSSSCSSRAQSVARVTTI